MMAASIMKQSTAPSSRRPEHLFIVRLWCEEAPDSNGPWRGSAAHVGSGQKFYFANLGGLTEFIMLRLDSVAEKNDEGI